MRSKRYIFFFFGIVGFSIFMIYFLYTIKPMYTPDEPPDRYFPSIQIVEVNSEGVVTIKSIDVKGIKEGDIFYFNETNDLLNIDICPTEQVPYNRTTKCSINITKCQSGTVFRVVSSDGSTVEKPCP